MDRKINVAILGAGNIAADMAKALNGITDEVNLYAVASRSIEKAREFAEKWNFTIAYGSYEDLADDDSVDLIYIATPHSEHYKNTKLCLESGRNCLVEKAFCANYKQSEELIKIAQEKNLMLAEAMWTRYQPSKDMIREIIESGKLGKIISVEADFSVPIKGVDRLVNPALAGGALLDLGVYSLTVPAMYFGNDIVKVSTKVVKADTGVDATTIAKLYYSNGIIATAKCSAIDDNSNYAKVIGEEGTLVFGPINVPTKIEVFDVDDKCISEVVPEIRVNGYEYEVLECKKALLEGKSCPESMPHSETLKIMSWMDAIRYSNDIIYPFETKEDLVYGVNAKEGFNTMLGKID